MADRSTDANEAGPSALQLRAQDTWEAFCEELKQAGRQLVREDLPLDPLDAAEGLRYLTRLLRTGLERHVEGADPADAYLFALCDERIKGFGGDNPDVAYLGATVSGGYEYRLRGDFRSCSYFTLMTTGVGPKGEYRVTGSLDGDAIPGCRSGPVEIAIRSREVDAASRGARVGEAPVAAVLDMTSETRSLLVRCTFDDMDAKQALRLALTRVDADGESFRCDFEPISAGLLETVRFVRSSAETWTGQSAALRRNLNVLPLTDPERMRKMGGDPNIFYYSAAWSVAEDEFLVIRIPTIPECSAWGFQLNNVWTESLDYTRAPIHLNKRTAHYDADGGVTIVVSERDPGRPNWLRTQGHRSGTANLRLMGAKEPLVAELCVVSRPEDIDRA
ncbi:MAG: hypothetical protein H6748_16635 [Spirochaetaceae bacterium]|nr:hypothetical protein [Myxococcales bacterium]MCB9725676.1 hypothetical protein [Spirochaetaceae bacterium]